MFFLLLFTCWSVRSCWRVVQWTLGVIKLNIDNPLIPTTPSCLGTSNKKARDEHELEWD